MKPSLLILIAFAPLLAACSQGVEVEHSGARTQPVIDGVASPDQFHFSIGRYQRNAIVGQVVHGSQGCTGTVVGDRLVVSAAHCVVTNQSAWLNGATPKLGDPSMLTYQVGDDISSPLCTLQAKEIHIHPDAGMDPSTGAIRHDISLIVLDKSVIDSCPEIVPVQLNREPLTSEIVGQLLLQGGYGSLDHSYHFSRVRYWSLQRVSALGSDYFAFRSVHGGPSFGDSGAGFLRRFPDGSLRTIGVDSLASGLLGSAVRTDAQGAFIDSLATPARVCGTITSNGVCRGNAAVSCGPRGFLSDDCEQTGRTCVIEGGRAKCVCSCDVSPGCDSGCACDPVCPEADAGVDAGVLDPEGPPPTGTCTSVAALVDLDACGPGYACDIADFVNLATGCRPVGELDDYRECSVSSKECKAGATCLPLSQSGWTCSPFCKDMMQHSTCPGRGICLPIMSPVGNCVEPDDCDLAGSTGCSFGDACYPIDDGTFCLPAGGTKEGAPCVSLNDCKRGLGCVHGRCRRWCKTNTDCQGRSCDDIGTTTVQADIGVCSDGPMDAGADAKIPTDGGVDVLEADAQGDSQEPFDAARDTARFDATDDATAQELEQGDDASAGGCGCRTAPSGPTSPLWLLALLSAASLTYRRWRGPSN